MGPDGDEEQRFFFVHLQKTAGTSLFHRLRRHFGPDAVYPTPEFAGDLVTSFGVDELVERVRARRGTIRLVTGHFPLCTEELLEWPVTTFTVLREPVDRTLSFLRHQRREPQFATATLEAIYGAPFLPDLPMREVFLNDHMCRMLALTVPEMTGGVLTPLVVDDDRLEQAKANLADRIDLMGVQEHFEEFCDELAARYRWDLGPPRTVNTSEPIEVPDALRERIAEDNRHDVELYRFAVELWRSRRAEPGSGGDGA